MLIEFSVTNFRSIAGTQTFSFVADESKQDGDKQVFVPSGSEYVAKLNLLKTAAVYGANAAGKSNVIKAMSVMKRVISQSAKSGQRGDELPVAPFKLDADLAKAPSEFEAVFIADGVRYQYGFSASASRIFEEWLFAYPKGRPQNWFNRAWDAESKTYQWSFGTGLLGEKQVWKNATRENALFLSTAVQLNSEQLKPVFDWFDDHLRMIGVNGFPPVFSAEYCFKSGGLHEVLNFLKQGDVGIDDLEVKADAFNPEALPEDMPQALRDMLLNEMQGKEVYEIQTMHRSAQGDMIPFILDDESTGTQKLFAFAGPWLDTLKNGYVLFVDELHDNLHPKLVQYLVELFHDAKTNPRNAQLFFTTHETSILNQSVFRRDQVWFCEKDERSATQLFPLTDFSPRKNRDNLEAAYLSGRYGAVPFIEPLK
jgi:hypothetical protein